MDMLLSCCSLRPSPCCASASRSSSSISTSFSSPIPVCSVTAMAERYATLLASHDIARRLEDLINHWEEIPSESHRSQLISTVLSSYKRPSRLHATVRTASAAPHAARYNRGCLMQSACMTRTLVKLIASHAALAALAPRQPLRTRTSGAIRRWLQAFHSSMGSLPGSGCDCADCFKASARASCARSADAAAAASRRASRWAQRMAAASSCAGEPPATEAEGATAALRFAQHVTAL